MANEFVNGRALRAASRHRATDWMDEAEQSPHAVPDQDTIDAGEVLRGDLALTFKTKSGSPAEIRIPHGLTGVLVTIILALVSGGYWLVSTLAGVKSSIDEVSRNQAKIESHLITQQAYIISETNKVVFMQALMTKEQQAAVAEYERTHPKPILPNLKGRIDQ